MPAEAWVVPKLEPPGAAPTNRRRDSRRRVFVPFSLA
jgi:hypothetical protein